MGNKKPPENLSDGSALTWLVMGYPRPKRQRRAFLDPSQRGFCIIIPVTLNGWFCMVRSQIRLQIYCIEVIVT